MDTRADSIEVMSAIGRSGLPFAHPIVRRKRRVGQADALRCVCTHGGLPGPFLRFPFTPVSVRARLL
jgi:hypothetical protein